MAEEPALDTLGRNVSRRFGTASIDPDRSGGGDKGTLKVTLLVDRSFLVVPSNLNVRTIRWRVPVRLFWRRRTAGFGG
jgi:hypothetical protein